MFLPEWQIFNLSLDLMTFTRTILHKQFQTQIAQVSDNIFFITTLFQSGFDHVINITSQEQSLVNLNLFLGKPKF